jgi:hypothetical protein
MKNVTGKEKIVFVVLLIFLSAFARAVGMSMSFSKTLIFLSLLFLIYKYFSKRLNTDKKKKNNEKREGKK